MWITVRVGRCSTPVNWQLISIDLFQQRGLPVLCNINLHFTNYETQTDRQTEKKGKKAYFIFPRNDALRSRSLTMPYLLLSKNASDPTDITI